MRDIRFRAWDKKEKQMNWTDKAQLNQGKAIKFNFMMPWRDNVFADEWELMQFTGLKDKNGKEIYEGDIVKGRIVNGWSEEDETYVVEWIGWNKNKNYIIGQANCGFYPFNYFSTNGCNEYADEWFDLNSCEVIGNIYENPELIKGTK